MPKDPRINRSQNPSNKRNEITGRAMKRYEKNKIPNNYCKTLLEILGINEGCCTYCTNPIDNYKQTLKGDEIIPCTKNNSDNLLGRINKFNQIPCCKQCNSSKNTKNLNAFYDWVTNGGHPERKIPYENRSKMISWVIENKNLLCCNDNIMIGLIDRLRCDIDKIYEMKIIVSQNGKIKKECRNHKEITDKIKFKKTNDYLGFTYIVVPK